MFSATSAIGSLSVIDFCRHIPTLVTELSAATINFDALTTRGLPEAQGASYIPFADRYAVVPDHGEAEATPIPKPAEGEPSGKRHCSW